MAQTQQPPEHFLHAPYNMPPTPQLAAEQAADLLLRSAQAAAMNPFTWQNIDKPQEGENHVIAQVTQIFPNDGIRYLEPGQPVTYSLANGRGEIEITEDKAGYIPGVDQIAWRARKRLNTLAIPAGLLHLPVRGPLRPPTDPPVNIYQLPNGPRLPPQVAAAAAAQASAQAQRPSNAGHPGGLTPQQMAQVQAQQQAAAIAQQQQAAAAAHAQAQAQAQAAAQQQAAAQAAAMRQAQPAAAAQAVRGAPVQSVQPVKKERKKSLAEAEDTLENLDSYTPRDLAVSRFRTNHNYLAEVFSAYSIHQYELPPSPWASKDKVALEEQLAKLEKENEELERAGQEKIARVKGTFKSLADGGPLPVEE